MLLGHAGVCGTSIDVWFNSTIEILLQRPVLLMTCDSSVGMIRVVTIEVARAVVVVVVVVVGLEAAATVGGVRKCLSR
jgi:hypothetical protein